MIKEIWEVSYIKPFVPIFKRKSVDNMIGAKIDKSKMTLVGFQKIRYQDKPLSYDIKLSKYFMSKILCMKTGLLCQIEKNNVTTMKKHKPNNDIWEIGSFTRMMINKDYKDVIDVMHFSNFPKYM